MFVEAACSKDIRDVWKEFSKGDIGAGQTINDISTYIGDIQTFRYIPGRSITLYGKDDACRITLNGEEGTGAFRNLIYLMRRIKMKRESCEEEF